MSDLAGKNFLAVIGGGLILCWAAGLNGYPLLFPDVWSYLTDGINLMQKQWPDNQRPVFYGIVIWFLHLKRSLWPIVIAQGIVLSCVTWLTLRVRLVSLPPSHFLAIMLLLAIGSSLSVYVSYVLPDVFLGVLVLGIYLMLFARDRMSRLETAFVFLLVALSICFHLTYVLLACAITVLSIVVWALSRKSIRPGLLVCALVLALTVFFSFSLLVYKRFALTPNSPPIVLARLIADGPAKTYLEDECGQKHYALCPYLEQLPNNQDQFLWVVFPQLTKEHPQLWDQVRGEQGAIILGTVEDFPIETAKMMLFNAARQTIDFGSSIFSVSPRAFSKYPFVVDGYENSLQAQGRISNPQLEQMNKFHAVVAGVSLILMLAYMRCNAAMNLTILVSLITNAFACGALSGAADRYEGRGIWLLLLCAIISLRRAQDAPEATLNF